VSVVGCVWMACHALCRPWGGCHVQAMVTIEGVCMLRTKVTVSTGGRGGLGVSSDGVVGDGASCAKVITGEF